MEIETQRFTAGRPGAGAALWGQRLGSRLHPRCVDSVQVGGGAGRKNKDAEKSLRGMGWGSHNRQRAHVDLSTCRRAENRGLAGCLPASRPSRTPKAQTQKQSHNRTRPSPSGTRLKSDLRDFIYNGPSPETPHDCEI